jgi:hypothetical protein
MPAGKFDRELAINDHGCLSPAGPLELDKGETVLRLDVWVFQKDNAACVAVQRVFPDSSRWTTNPDPVEDHKGGPFLPGPATAMALIVSRTANGQTQAFQWTQGITLFDGKVGSGH